MRELFAKLIKKLESKGFNMIYVDEASACPQNIALYSGDTSINFIQLSDLVHGST